MNRTQQKEHQPMPAQERKVMSAYTFGDKADMSPKKPFSSSEYSKLLRRPIWSLNEPNISPPVNMPAKTAAASKPARGCTKL